MQDPNMQQAVQQEKPKVNHFEQHFVKTPGEDTKEVKKKDTYMTRFAERFAETDARIAERGTVQDSLRKKFDAGGFVNNTLAVLEIMAIPLDAVESSFSNVGLHFQKKALSDKTKYPNLQIRSNEVDPRSLDSSGKRIDETIQEAKTIATKFVQGLTVQQKGQFGDIYKNAGVNPVVADAAGLFVRFGGATKLLSEAGKVFGSISKMTDKGISQAGVKLVGATDKARQTLGQEVGTAFKPTLNDPVDGLKFLDDAVKLPKSVIKAAETHFGTKLEDLANGLNVGKLREFKQFIGGLRPSAWGKDARGVAERIDDKALNAAYSGIKTLLKDTLKSSRGTKVADNLMNLESAYSRVIRAGDAIKTVVVDRVLKEPTRAGAAASKLIKEGDVTFRTALNVIKKSGWDAQREINGAVKLLESYNRQQLISNLIKGSLRGSIIGGAAGAAGGSMFRKMTQGQESGYSSGG